MAQTCTNQTQSAITVVRLPELSAFISEMRDDAASVRHHEVRWSTETVTQLGDQHVNFETLTAGYIAEHDGQPKIVELRVLCGSITGDLRSEEIRADEQIAAMIAPLEAAAIKSGLDLRDGKFTLDPSPLLPTPQDMLRAFCPMLLTPDGTTYSPWTDGQGVGLRCRRSDGLCSYLYLNASATPDRQHSSVFTYLGPAGDSGQDAAQAEYDPFTTQPITRIYTVRSENGDRDWHADSAQHAREQHNHGFAGAPGETIRHIFPGAISEHQPQSTV